MPIVEMQHVRKAYDTKIAVADLSFTIEPGSMFGLLGPNGSGKTTLIRTLLGLIPIDAGGGRVLDMDIRKQRLDIRQAVGFVPEDECVVVCPRHGSRFDIRTGQALTLPAYLPVDTYPVRVEDGMVKVDLEA